MQQTTASRLIDRALHIADIANTDFLTHTELTDYMNDCYKALYQNIIEANLDLFTVEAHLVGTSGVYQLPWDCYQVKEIKNPITGTQIIRKTSSMGKYSNGYTIKNNAIIIDGINPGPVVIAYWRIPYFISIPNKTVECNISANEIIDTSVNNILYKDGNYLAVWTPKGLVSTNIDYHENEEYHLVQDQQVLISGTVENEDGNQDYCVLADLNGNNIWETDKKPFKYIKSDDGIVYIGYKSKGKLDVYKLDKLIATLDKPQQGNEYVCIDHNFYEVPKGAFPIGLFDSRPAYTYDDTLCLINPNKSVIKEQLDLPIMKADAQLKYGIISNGKIYSNIPDTIIDFPNNILYELLAYRLAQCFLAKQGAKNDGVQAMYNSIKQQFFASIDVNPDFQRMRNVR